MDQQLAAVGQLCGCAVFLVVACVQDKTPVPRAVLEGRKGPVLCVQFSPDSKLLATGSPDGTVVIWNAATAKSWAVLEGHKEVVGCVAFSPDGKTLGFRKYDRTIILWDPLQRRQLGTLAGHGDSVMGVGFLPDGATLVSGALDKTVRFWDLSTRTLRKTIKLDSQVMAIASSPDARLLAAGYGERKYPGTVRIWTLKDGRERITLKAHKNLITSVAFSPDSRILATGSYDKTAKLWEATTGKPLATLQ
jgi:WD40 repeat protein